MAKLIWIESNGGPLVLLSDTNSRCWNVSDSGEFDLPDYDRACSVEGYIENLDVNGEQALVLGDEPLMSTIININLNPVVVRWYFGESRESVDRYSMALDLNALKWEFSLRVLITGQELLLMDASLRFEDTDSEDYLRITIQPGLYDIYTTIHGPDSQTRLLVHKFERLG